MEPTLEGCAGHRAAEGAPSARLRILGTSRVVALAERPMRVGSAPENDLVLTDRYVSKHHCRLSRRGGVVWVEDLNSLNGTWVDGVRVERGQLAARGRVVVGETALELLAPGGRGRRWGLVGEHPAMERLFRQIQRLASSRSPVLILGETGTGKELVARAIHEASPAHLGPFEAINCGAIPRDLAESEFFGHARGAFTGAARAHSGAFERADGGTLFLDEIGELPQELQPKLLRVLEDGVLHPVGGEERRPVTVRLVAATHRDLLLDARQGRFRLDLFHRLAVGVLQIPALRERREDIPHLVEHFLRELGDGGQRVTLDDGVMPFLASQSWPGNVRALRNALQRAAIIGGPRLGVEDFDFLGEAERSADQGFVRFEGRPFHEVRREIYLRVLTKHGGNRSAAATELGVPKSTFFDQLRGMEL